MSITPQWKDELRARVTLSTLINRTTKLTRAGREWKACCPFHNEATPSFYVNDQKGFYHCFGCGAHGDVISWMTEQRGLSFIDACKELAGEAGMEVPAPDPVAAKKAEKRAELIDVTTDAQQWFFDNLRSPDGHAAMNYLTDRGLKPETLAEFGFGFAPESKQALNNAVSQFEDQMLVETGMRIKTDDGTTYDRFRGRVMLPIQDARGRVIAFGGRIMDKRDGVAKYLNSPDTPLFDKGRTLYNLHRASPASRETGRAIVVEGYMDVIALAQAGIKDAVAPLGTALTETQLQMLWRMVEVPLLCFDGDKAGERAAMRAVERALPLLRAPNSLSILKLPGGADPDDLIKDYGVDYFNELLAKPTPLVRFIWESERDATPLDTPEQKAFLRERLIEQAFKIKDETLRKLYRRELVDLYYRHLYPSSIRDGGPQKTALLTDENIKRLKHFLLHGSRQELIRATLAAIARNPELIPKYNDLVWRIKPQTVETELAIDVFLEAGECILDGVSLPEKLDEIAELPVMIPFPFLKREMPVSQVEKYLDEAFVLLVQKPDVERFHEQSVLRYGSEPSEENGLRMMELAQLRNSLAKRERNIARTTLVD